MFRVDEQPNKWGRTWRGGGVAAWPTIPAADLHRPFMLKTQYELWSEKGVKNEGVESHRRNLFRIDPARVDEYLAGMALALSSGALNRLSKIRSRPFPPWIDTEATVWEFPRAIEYTVGPLHFVRDTVGLVVAAPPKLVTAGIATAPAISASVTLLEGYDEALSAAMWRTVVLHLQAGNPLTDLWHPLWVGSHVMLSDGHSQGWVPTAGGYIHTVASGYEHTSQLILDMVTRHYERWCREQRRVHP